MHLNRIFSWIITECVRTEMFALDILWRFFCQPPPASKMSDNVRVSPCEDSAGKQYVQRSYHEKLGASMSFLSWTDNKWKPCDATRILSTPEISSKCKGVWPGESPAAFFNFEKQSSRPNNHGSMYFSSTCVTWSHCQSCSGIRVILCLPLLLHSPPSHPSHQAHDPCLMKGSPLLHISGRVRQGDKGGCWSNTDKSPLTETHICCSTFSFDLWLCREPRSEVSLSLWTGAFQRRSLALSLSLSLSYRDLCVRSYVAIIWNPAGSSTGSSDILSRTARRWIQNGAVQNIHITEREHDTGDVEADWLRRLGLQWADSGLL